MPGGDRRWGDGREAGWTAYLRLDRTEAPDPDPEPRGGQGGWIELLAWSQTTSSLRDAASGLPTGKRRHHPLVVAKPAGRSSRRLLASLLDGEVLEECALEIWRPARAAADRCRVSADDLLGSSYDEAFELFRQRLRRSRRREERHCAARLENARIVRIETEMPGGPWLLPEFRQPCERVSLSYERITWTWYRGGEKVSVTDRWPAGVDNGDSPSSEEKPPGIVVRARESDRGAKVWAVASVAARGRAKAPKDGVRPANGVDLIYSFKYESKAPAVVGSCRTDSEGRAEITLPGDGEHMPPGRYRFSLTGARRGGKKLSLAGNRNTGWISP